MYLNLFLLTPVIIMGLIGNVLSMLTWSRGCHRKTSTAALLTALAVMDTVVLTMPALEYWTLHVFNIWLRRSNIFACKLLGFASYFGPSASSWIVVLITTERLVSIWFPVKVRIVCTRTKMCLCVAIACFLLAAVYSPFIVETQLFYNEVNNVTTCDWKDNTDFYKNYYTPWMWVDLCLLFMIPFIIIVICNSLILYKILKSRTILIREGRYISYRTRIANAFTIRAILLGIFFLVCLLPVTSNEVYLAHTGETFPPIVDNMSHILLYANSALNFILYCAIGSGFRTDMKRVIMNLFSKKKITLEHQETTVSTHAHKSLLNRNNDNKYDNNHGRSTKHDNNHGSSTKHDNNHADDHENDNNYDNNYENNHENNHDTKC